MEEKRDTNDDKSELNPPPLDKTPWLVHTKPEGFQIFCTTSPLPPNNKYYIKSIPQLCGKSIIGSSFDWLILQNHYDKRIFSLYNPVTLAAIDDLPPLLDLEDYRNVNLSVGGTLTLPPNFDNYPRACVLFLCCRNQAFFCYPTTSNPFWISQNIELSGDKAHIYTPVVLNEIIYCWGRVYRGGRRCPYFLSMEVVSHHYSKLLSITFMPLSHPHDKLCFGDFLIESCGQIYCVTEAANNQCIKVWEFDLQRRSWFQVKCLDGRAFFLGVNCSTWCWGTTNDPESTGGIQENGLYIALSKTGHGDLYSCRLDDGWVMFLYSCKSSLIPPDSNDCPAWFMPQNQRLLTGQERKVNQIFERVDKILHKLDMTIRTECQMLPQQKQTQNSYLCQLPSDIMDSISRKLPLFDHWNFRATCKMFQAAFLPAPEWRTHDSLPLFIYFKNDEGLFEVKNPRRNDSCSSFLSISQHPCTIASSKMGWLLMKSQDQVLHFVNPFTKIVYHLPTHKFIVTRSLISVGFSTHPTSLDCVTAGYCCGYVADSILYFCNRDRTWKQYDLDEQFPGPPCSVVYYREVFHFMNPFGYLGVFKLIDRKNVSWKFYGKRVDINPTSHFWAHSTHLVECGGDLLVVFIGIDHKDEIDDNTFEIALKAGAGVRVFKMVSLRKKWIQVKSLGNYCLFVGPSSFSVAAREHEMRNRIYLPRFKADGMVYYALETGTFYVDGNKNALEDLSCTKIPLQYGWV